MKKSTKALVDKLLHGGAFAQEDMVLVKYEPVGGQLLLDVSVRAAGTLSAMLKSDVEVANAQAAIATFVAEAINEKIARQEVLSPDNLCPITNDFMLAGAEVERARAFMQKYAQPADRPHGPVAVSNFEFIFGLHSIGHCVAIRDLVSGAQEAITDMDQW